MMKRILLAATVILAGCSVIKPHSLQGTLILKPQYTGGQYGIQAQVDPYTKSSIHHLSLKLYTFDGTEHDLNTKQTLLNAQLDNPIVFSNLKPATTYRIKAYAYAGSDDSALISDVASSTIAVTVGNDDRPTFDEIKVMLVNRDFNGIATSSGLVVTPGSYQPLGPERSQYVCKGLVRTLAGGSPGTADGTGFSAQFSQPSAVAADRDGNLYVADNSSHRIRKVSLGGVVSTLAGSTVGTADGLGTNAQFNLPYGLTVDANGNVYVADSGSHRIRKITAAGMVSTLAGSSQGTQDGVGTTAQLSTPYGLAVAGDGTVYFADFGSHRIRKIASDGLVSTVAGGTQGTQDGTGTLARFNSPVGLTLDASGSLYVADYGNHRIRKILPDGSVVTVAGSTQGTADGLGTAAQFNAPVDLAIDGFGNVYVADRDNYRIRKITSDGVVSTLAGSTVGFAEGFGTAAKFTFPRGIAVDLWGNIYVADKNAYRIRVIE